MDVFTPEFKYYKRRIPSPDLSSVVDFSAYESNRHADVTDVHLSLSSGQASFAESGLQPADTWTCHGLRQCPGLYFIRNPFLSEGQRSWIRRCLVEYPCPSNRTNVDAMMARLNVSDPETSVWNHHVHNRSKSLLSRLRWVTLGYHHDWNTKIYDLNEDVHFPEDLRRLSNVIASTLGFFGFRAESAIVNFYDRNSSLSGHTDHSELDSKSPLLSISFGQSAIFLIGGATKETKPYALYLRSGDVVVMSGASRLAYHAVPRILPSDTRPWLIAADDDLAETTEWTLIKDYMERFRINLNIRQVFPPAVQ